MKQDKVHRAYEISLRGGIEYNPQMRAWFVPSFTVAGRDYIVSESALCTCNSTFLCSHAIACFNAYALIFQFRWASNSEMLDAVADFYRASIEQMPGRVKALIASEYRLALSRIQTPITEPVKRNRQYKSRQTLEGFIVSRKEAATDYGAISIT